MIEYKIFPAIGVARVGNAPEKYYVGPEKYCGLPTNPDGSPFTQADFRDSEKRMCRQASLFHVFKVEDGVQTEVTLATPGVKSITWHAHLANKKASWYDFKCLLGEDGYAPNHPLRNPTAGNRHELVIDAGPRQISGANQQGVAFDRSSVPPGYRGAHFPPGVLNPTRESIDTLGELRTDAQGRLLVLGGLGISGTAYAEPNIPAGQYANNDGWWDDTSDGPVKARIELDDGTVIDVAPSWVLVGPPSFAPELPNLVTLYDTIHDTMVRNGHHPEIYADGFWKKGPEGYRPNFDTDIRPLLERPLLYAWVAAIPPKPHKFDFEKLGAVEVIDGRPQGAASSRGLRQYVFDFVRPPGGENVIVKTYETQTKTGSGQLGGVGSTMMPFLAGDNALLPDAPMSQYLRLTDTQFFYLQQWADGWFEAGAPRPQQPGAALTRGVLENCVGGPFSPGIEMSWISRNPAIYCEPYRIRAHFAEAGPLSLDFNPQRGMEPGDISRYMALPWQADFNECSSQPTDGRTLWWWPAQRPEYVYLEPPQPVLAATAVPVPSQKSGVQVPWIGTDFNQNASSYIQFGADIDMVTHWAQLGFVMEKEVEGERRFVEVERTLPRPFVG